MTDPEVEAQMQALFDEAAELADVKRVISPYSDEGSRQIASEGPEAGTIAYAEVELPEDIDFIGIMIGLGVGIDYALLIVTRYRDQLHAGHTVCESIAIAMDTAGRWVLFAGTTVVISFLGMLLVGVTFVNGVALGAALVVAITVASLTLLPALLGFAATGSSARAGGVSSPPGSPRSPWSGSAWTSAR